MGAYLIEERELLLQRDPQRGALLGRRGENARLCARHQRRLGLVQLRHGPGQTRSPQRLNKQKRKSCQDFEHIKEKIKDRMHSRRHRQRSPPSVWCKKEEEKENRQRPEEERQEQKRKRRRKQKEKEKE